MITAATRRLIVRTHPDLGEPPHWLRALDPLEFGRAAFVRSEWRPKIEDATIFPSRGYAEDVVTNNLNPIRLKWAVVPAP